ncbi:MAG: COQ9 family protein [Kiloniellales bacterium]|nr:COQ9 family protein [Kiloniellales bacterium]
MAARTTTIDKTRETLLLASLAHVPFDGWSEAAIRAGAADAGLSPAEALNAFPAGPTEALALFSDWADREMLARLDKADLGAMKVREKVAAGVRLRLEALAPHKEAVRRGLAVLALPANAGQGLKSLHRTVDAIWTMAGDRATDYNYYTKRLLLAGVLTSTTLYWLNDRSEGHQATWAFLERRIDEVLKVGGSLGKTMKGLLDLPDRLMAARGPRGFARR